MNAGTAATVVPRRGAGCSERFLSRARPRARTIAAPLRTLHIHRNRPTALNVHPHRDSTRP